MYAHSCDYNEFTQHTIISIKKKSPEIIPNTIISAAMGFVFLGTQERVRNSRGIRAISVQATEVLLYIWKIYFTGNHFFTFKITKLLNVFVIKQLFKT